MKAPFMIRPALPALTLAAALLTAGLALAQGMAVGFGGLRQDPAAPVEVTSDGLTVDQATGRAVFDGNVLVVQGALRMTAARVEVDAGLVVRGLRKSYKPPAGDPRRVDTSWCCATWTWAGARWWRCWGRTGRARPPAFMPSRG
jgi:hypothetical protein